MGYVSLADLACVPPTAGETGLSRSDMGFVDAIIGAVGTVAAAGIQFAGVKVATDAQKYAIKRQTATQLNVALAEQKTQLAVAQAQLEAQKLVAMETTEQVRITQTEQTKQVQTVGSSALPVAILGLSVAGAIAIWVSNKDQRR